MPVQASDHAQVKVLLVLVPGRRLMNQAGSTVNTIAQDGPSSERGRGKHPNEVFQSSGAGRRSTVKTFGLSSPRMTLAPEEGRGYGGMGPAAAGHTSPG